MRHSHIPGHSAKCDLGRVAVCPLSSCPRSRAVEGVALRPALAGVPWGAPLYGCSQCRPHWCQNCVDDFIVVANAATSFPSYAGPAHARPTRANGAAVVINSTAIHDASCKARTKWRSNTMFKRALLCISFRRPLSKSFDGCYLARPVIEWTRRRASHAGAGIHIALDVCHAGDLRAVADLHVADDTGMRTHDDEVAKFRRTRNPALSNNYAMAADDDVVCDLHEIVDLSALPNDCVRQGTSVDGGVERSDPRAYRSDQHLYWLPCCAERPRRTSGAPERTHCRVWRSLMLPWLQVLASHCY